MTSPLKRMLRDAVIPPVAKVPAVHRRAVRRWAQVNIGYPGSPMTRPDRSRSHPRPGERVPDLPVATSDGTSSLYRVLRWGGHVLVVDGADPKWARASMAGTSYRDLVQIVTAAPVSRRRRQGTPIVYLVRPDGYLTARGTHGHGRLGAIHDYLRALAPDPSAHSPATTLPA